MKSEEKQNERQTLKSYIHAIYNGEIDVETIKSQDPVLYFLNKNQLDSVEREYRNDKVEPPQWRFNLLLAGVGGTGKTTLANLIAKKLGVTTFSFTDIDAGFNEYTNEQAIIWDEMRSNYIKEWKISRFLTATNNGKYNNARIRVLYGVVKLGQNYNFITTSENARDFLTGLTDRYYTDNTRTTLTEPENPDQITRRFRYVLEFGKKQIDKDTQETTVTLLEYNPMKDDMGTYTFYDKYEVVKTWKVKTTEETHEWELTLIADEIAKNINGIKLNTDAIKEV